MRKIVLLALLLVSGLFAGSRHINVGNASMCKKTYLDNNGKDIYDGVSDDEKRVYERVFQKELEKIELLLPCKSSLGLDIKDNEDIYTIFIKRRGITRKSLMIRYKK